MSSTPQIRFSNGGRVIAGPPNEGRPYRMMPARPPVLPADLYTVTQAAQMARLNVITVYRWIQRGLITGYGRPGCYRVSLSELMPPVTEKGRKTARTRKEG